MDDSHFDEDSDKDWPRPPYAWIITPLLIFTIIAIAATLMQLRRRRAARLLAAAHAQRVTGDPRRRAAPPPGRARRWVGMRRREESVDGLDEYGEAPPPYEPAGAKKGDVEMGDVGGPPGYTEYYGDASAVQAPPAVVTHER